MDNVAARERAEYCRRMAHLTYDLAEQSDDAEMIGGYLALAAKWLAKAEAAEREGREA